MVASSYWYTPGSLIPQYGGGEGCLSGYRLCGEIRFSYGSEFPSPPVPSSLVPFASTAVSSQFRTEEIPHTAK